MTTKTKKTSRRGAAFKMFAAPAIAALLISPPGTKAAVVTRPDTSKKVYNVTTYGNLSTSDSSIYVVNGKKVSKAEFNKLNPKDVMNISWVSAENAAKVLDNFRTGNSVLFVTTDDSQEGKKLLARINKLPHNRAYIAREGKHPLYVGANNSSTGVSLNSAGNYVATTAGDGISTAGDDSGVIMVNGKKSKAHITNTTGSGMSYVLAGGDRENEVVTLSNAEPVITRQAISQLNEKLVIIDDKVATADDLKKLSAFDIEKINYKNDNYTRHQYGDKAKKGVVYIYTKKTKK